MTKPNHPEIGRELLAGELRERQIVWLQKEGRGVTASLWAMRITPGYIEFFAGQTKTYFLARRLPDGHITDDSGAAMAIYEYLGEP